MACPCVVCGTRCHPDDESAYGLRDNDIMTTGSCLMGVIEGVAKGSGRLTSGVSWNYVLLSSLSGVVPLQVCVCVCVCMYVCLFVCVRAALVWTVLCPLFQHYKRMNTYPGLSDLCLLHPREN